MMRRRNYSLVLGLAGFGLLCVVSRLCAGNEPANPTTVSAEILAKEYAEDEKAADEKYKGKVLTVEGATALRISGGIPFRVRYIMMKGYQKPGVKAPFQVFCDATPNSAYLRVGQK